MHRYFDFEALAEVTQQVTSNLNRIIDVNYYPVETARRSNMRHRPIGMGVQVCAGGHLSSFQVSKLQHHHNLHQGLLAAQSGCRLALQNTQQFLSVGSTCQQPALLMSKNISLQGLADTFILLGLPFDSPEAQQLNQEIFEAIYYTGLKTSCELAVKEGA